VNCNSTITTEEVPRYETAIAVRQTDGTLEPFSRDILLVSLYKSLAHRKTATEDAAALAKTTLAMLQAAASSEMAIIAAQDIRQQALACLERFDTAAGSHYRAYHSS
jgi:transcriptional regulator NrdR family protein